MKTVTPSSPSRTVRIINMAVDILMEEHGLTRKQAERRVERTIEALGDTGLAKLTPGEISSIREAMDAGWSSGIVGRVHGVSKTTADLVGKRKVSRSIVDIKPPAR